MYGRVLFTCPSESVPDKSSHDGIWGDVTANKTF